MFLIRPTIGSVGLKWKRVSGTRGTTQRMDRGGSDWIRTGEWRIPSWSNGIIAHIKGKVIINFHFFLLIVFIFNGFWMNIQLRRFNVRF